MAVWGGNTPRISARTFALIRQDKQAEYAGNIFEYLPEYLPETNPKICRNFYQIFRTHFLENCRENVENNSGNICRIFSKAVPAELRSKLALQQGKTQSKQKQTGQMQLSKRQLH